MLLRRIQEPRISIFFLHTLPMEAANKRPSPPLPANYVSFLDLRDRWMKQQQQKKQAEEDDNKALQPNTVVQMEDADKRLPPPLPANYVSAVDLRDRWMKQHQQKKQGEEDRSTALQPNTEVQDDLKGEDKRAGDDGLQEEHHTAGKIILLNPNPSNAIRRPLLLNTEVQDDPEGEDKRTADDDLEEEHHPAEKSIPPNPNPNNAIRRPFQVTSRRTDKANYRWIQVGQKKQTPALPTIGWKQTQPVVRVEPKKLPMLHADKTKSPPSESPKTEIVVQVSAEILVSDKEVSDPKVDGGKKKKKKKKKKKEKKRVVRNLNKKINQTGDLAQSQPIKGILAPIGELEEKANSKVQVEPKAKLVLHIKQTKPPQPIKAPNVIPVVERCDEIHDSAVIVNEGKLDRAKKSKPSKYNKKRNQKVEDVIQPPNINPEQEANVEKDIKNADDNLRGETERKFAGPRMTSASGESCSRGFIPARNQHGWRKDGSYAKFERRFMLRKETPKNEDCLVWVRKGESSHIGAVAVASAGNLRV